MDLGTSTLGELAFSQTVDKFQALADVSANALTFTASLNAYGNGIGDFSSEVISFNNTITGYSRHYGTIEDVPFSFSSNIAYPEIHHTIFVNPTPIEITPSDTGIYHARIFSLDTAEVTITPTIDQVIADRYITLNSASININATDIDMVAYKRASILHKRLVIFNEEITEERFLEIFNELMEE